MPLDHSKSPGAFKTNVRTLMHDVGKSPHVQSREQALAIAYSTARRAGAKMAGGGGAPFGERMAARQMFHEGFLHGTGPGRVDHLPITVKGAAYVVPSEHLAAIGQGNSTAGADIMHRMLKTGPYGSAPAALKGTGAHIPHLNLTPKAPHLARGGPAHGVPIIAANGEFVISPENVRKIGGGDLDRGHKILDAWVMATRKKHIATLKALKPPRKD